MDQQLICNWLGLPGTLWPPDHYTLLGLRPGEADVDLIEQCVHERLMRIRCYQLSHPGLATEAMNRLAQAFMCLTDPKAKQAYDEGLLGKTAAVLAIRTAVGAANPDPAAAAGTATLTRPEPPPRAVVMGTARLPVALDPSMMDTAVGQPKTQVDWKNTPPPVRATQDAGPVAASESPPATNGNAALPAPTPAPETPAAAEAPTPAAETGPLPAPAAAEVPVAAPADPLIESARSSRAARRGLGTRRALYDRVVWTRQLLRAWDRAGRYLAKAKRRVVRAAEVSDFTRQLTLIDELLHGFPNFVGRPGKLGYRVVVMGQLENAVEVFNTLGLEEREALARDWTAGQTVLRTHLDFLRGEVKTLRRRNFVGRLLRPLRWALRDHSEWVLLALLVAAACVAVILLA
jgi:hypothetical protein